MGVALKLSAFPLFAVAYYAPIVLDIPTGLISDPRVRGLFDSLIHTPVVQSAVTTNFVGHLLPLIVTFWSLSKVAESITETFHLPMGYVRVMVLGTGWAFLISLNASIFPKSNYSYAFVSLAHPELAFALGTMLLVGFALAIKQSWNKHSRTIVVAALSVICLSAIVAMPAISTGTPADQNIIIIGIDSLSDSAYERLRPSLPNLAPLVGSGTRYVRAYTPLGRTFPAWLTVLSGKQPADHRAIFNLRNLNHVEKRDLVTTELQERGYRTVYAIDERRFNHIDESFGFDHVVGPNVGALDFVIQRINDAPLSNLMLQTRLGEVLLPFSYINTASYSNYDADGFVKSILNSTRGAKRLFLATHFESAHHPFISRHAVEKFTTPNTFWNRYAEALTAVDAQIGQLIAGLKEQGYLDSALVIVLSDHGEALGETEANITLGGTPREIRGFGHGMNILSDHENRIVLAVTEFTQGVPISTGETVNRQVSLLDIRALIAKFVEKESTDIEPANDCVVVETGIRLASVADYKTLNETAVANSSAAYYEIDLQGRLRLSEDRLPQLINAKDIGVRCHDHLTWYDHSYDHYFSIGLDTAGKSIGELPAPPHEVQAITAYRKRLLATVRR